MWSLSVIFLICSVSAVKYHKIPQNDGSWRFMDEEQIRQSIAEAPFYDPQTDIDFHLWTPSNPIESQIIPLYDTAALRNSNFNPAYPTILIVHGWGGDVGDKIIQGSREEYLTKGDYNVIGIDWSAGGSSPNYAASRARVNETGSAIADYIYFLTANAGANPRNFLPVGSSLGGQVVGYIGRHVQRLMGIKLPAVMSLDPAGVLFDWDSWEGRINTDDAEYVQIIHTNGGNLGLHKHLGHADFYVRGGKSQNGCGIDVGGVCSHKRAVEYWVEGINGGNFIGTKCGSYESVAKEGCDFLTETKNMFTEPLQYGEGYFWLNTNADPPYALD